MRKYFVILGIVIVPYFFLLPLGGADEIYLINGDRVSGTIISETDNNIVVETEALGEVSIHRKSVERIVTEAELEAATVKEEKQADWKRNIAIGFSKATGNTQNSQRTVALDMNRKTGQDEFTMKGSYYYSSSDRKMNSQKWYSIIRYAYSFWDKAWYNFYKLEADHDRFANIDYRLIPALGIGYWFSDTPDWKAMVEVAIGFQNTNFRDDTKDKNEAILVPRAFLEKKIFDTTTISEDITLYPSLEESGDYRLHSETTLNTALNEHLSLQLSFIDDYNSNPPGNTKKNDTRFITSLTYSF